MNFFGLLELISSVAGSGSAFGMRIRIQETNRMWVHADLDPKHCFGLSGYTMLRIQILFILHHIMLSSW
jgi:hypothetical protein